MRQHEPAVREFVDVAPTSSFKWHRHDYPGPLCRWNHHPEYEIHLIAYGTGRFMVGDKIGRFHAGQVVLVGPHLPHNWISDVAPGEILRDQNVVIQFTHEWVNACFEAMPEFNDLRDLFRLAARGVQFLGKTRDSVGMLMQDMGAMEGIYQVASMMKLLALMGSAPGHERKLLASRNVVTPETVEHDFVEKALHRIYSAPDAHFSMGELAREAGMSLSAYSRAFYRATGQNFTEASRKLRLSKACHLLETTDHLVSTVSTMSGFSNLSHFNRQFRREYGMTPTEFRRRLPE